MADSDFPAPSEGFVITHFLVSADVGASRDCYEGVLGGTTDDKPDVVLQGCELSDSRDRSWTRNPLLHARPRRTPHRSRPATVVLG